MVYHSSARSRISDQAKTVIVVGGGGGIGAAVAERLTSAGDTVVLLDRSLAAVEDVAGRLSTSVGRVVPLECDAANSNAMSAAIGHVVDIAGIPQGLVNCAGGGESIPFMRITGAEWKANIASNLDTVFVSCQQFSQLLIAEGHPGSIVNIGSTASQIARPGSSHYAAVKAAINQFTKCVAIETAKYGVRANVVCPGVVGSQRIIEYERRHAAEAHAKRSRVPMGRLGEPSEIASVVEFLLSDRASFVTGAVWNVDGGYTCGIANYGDGATT